MPSRFRYLLLMFLMLNGFLASAQIQIVSPYSRFGMGDLCESYNAWNLSMGQTSIGLRSPYHVNFGNPASYTAFDSLSFVFEGGFSAESVTLTSNVQSATRSYGTVGYLHFGLPVTRWWRTTLALLPYSNIGYNVLNEEFSDELGRVQRIYSGEGGINQFTWGNGIRFTKNLSAGVNISYMFGNMVRESTLQFPDSLYYSNFRNEMYLTMNDIYLTYGAQYTIDLKKDLQMTIGAVFAPNTKLSAKTDYISMTFFRDASGIEDPRDTIAKGTDVKGDILIPMMIGGGVSFSKTDKLLVGADFKWQNWKNFKAFGKKDSLVNSYQVSVGAEIIPDLNSYNNYLKRIRYRIGFMYQGSYLKLHNEQISEYSISLGCGLPLRGIKTGLNLGLQAGVKGTTVNDLIRESYLRFVVGFSIYERWFVKRKYN